MASDLSCPCLVTPSKSPNSSSSLYLDMFHLRLKRLSDLYVKMILSRRRLVFHSSRRSPREFSCLRVETPITTTHTFFDYPNYPFGRNRFYFYQSSPSVYTSLLSRPGNRLKVSVSKSAQTGQKVLVSIFQIPFRPEQMMQYTKWDFQKVFSTHRNQKFREFFFEKFFKFSGEFVLHILPSCHLLQVPFT